MKTIAYKVSFEKMISRLPALFAYLESDDYGVVSLHKATDSLNGCYGKIVENIKLPEANPFNNNFPMGVNLIVEDNVILTSGTTYSYRTLIDCYYQYREVLNEDDVFIKFIERAIGKIKVPNSVKGVATPEFIYLSNVKNLYNELVKMNKECKFYKENLERGITEKDSHLCCLCEKYEELGGDKYKDYIKTLIPQTENISEEYKGYAESNMTLDFVVDLTSTYQDFGIMTPYAPKWLPYKTYYEGDKVEFDNDLYICVKENTGVYDEELMTVVFSEIDKDGDRIFARYSDLDLFVNVMTPESVDEYNKAQMVVFNEDGYIRPVNKQDNLPLLIKGKKENNQESVEEINNPIQTDSKLADLRRFTTYYNDDGIAERPEKTVDWLFYYRKGVVVNIKTINDNFGNIAKLSVVEENGEIEASEEANDLAAYGDVIVDIVCDTNNRKIKFIYRTGVHLNAEGQEGQPIPIITLDDDNNKIIKWEKFVWDNDEKIGIKHEEEYNYKEGDDLDKLIKGEFTLEGIKDNFKFDDYIEGKYDKKLQTYKFEFITFNNSFNYDKTIAHQNVNIVSILSDVDFYRKNFNEFAVYDLFKEEYLNGITYKPTKNIDVHIERGSTSVFDKHLAFGEIKTLEDMINFQNQSFFKITSG